MLGIKSKKGQMGGSGPVGNYINWFAIAGVSVIFLGVMAIVKQAFRDTQETTDVAYTILNDSLNLFSGLTGQFATVGTIAGTLFLLVVLALVGFWGYSRTKGM
jgi:hypothetical protein